MHVKVLHSFFRDQAAKTYDLTSMCEVNGWSRILSLKLAIAMAIEKYEETLTAATWAGRAGWQGACLLDFWIDSTWRYEKETTRLEREGEGEKKDVAICSGSSHNKRVAVTN